MRRRDEGILLSVRPWSPSRGESESKSAGSAHSHGFPATPVNPVRFICMYLPGEQVAIVRTHQVGWLGASSSVLDAHSDCAENMASLEVPEWLKDHPELQAMDIKLFRGFKPVSPSHLMITYSPVANSLIDLSSVRKSLLHSAAGW